MGRFDEQLLDELTEQRYLLAVRDLLTFDQLRWEWAPSWTGGSGLRRRRQVDDYVTADAAVGVLAGPSGPRFVVGGEVVDSFETVWRVERVCKSAASAADAADEVLRRVLRAAESVLAERAMCDERWV